MHLVSLAAPDRAGAGPRVRFAEGERIHTENSHKYSVTEFQSLAAAAGWRPVKAWTDADRLFSLHLLRSAISPDRYAAGLPGTPMAHSSAARSHFPSDGAAS